jgi:hypothetical protein
MQNDVIGHEMEEMPRLFLLPGSISLKADHPEELPEE